MLSIYLQILLTVLVNLWCIGTGLSLQTVIGSNVVCLMIFIFKIYEHYINHDKKEK